MLEWKNFREKEFCQVMVNGVRYPVGLDAVGKWLLDHLVSEVLQPIRGYFGRPVIVTCGARNWEIYQAIRKEADKDPTRPKPSRKSDHFFANAVHPYGVGAADITITGIDPMDILTYVIQGGLPVGQAIAYPSRRFIHLSNPKSLLFSEEVVGSVFPEKARYLVWDHRRGYRKVG